MHDEYLAAAREIVNKQIPLLMSGAEALVVIATMQMACRHPRIPHNTRSMAEKFARELQQIIAPDANSVVAIILENGWRNEP